MVASQCRARQRKLLAQDRHQQPIGDRGREGFSVVNHRRPCGFVASLDYSVVWRFKSRNLQTAPRRIRLPAVQNYLFISWIGTPDAGVSYLAAFTDAVRGPEVRFVEDFLYSFSS